jgi:hypothetical protein
VLPRSVGRHWTGAVIHFGSKQIVFADSLGSKDSQFCRRLWCLLEVASRVLRQQPFDFTGWSWGSLGALAPKQPTCYDCGVFAAILLVSIASRSGVFATLKLVRFLRQAVPSCMASSCVPHPVGVHLIWISYAKPLCSNCCGLRSFRLSHDMSVCHLAGRVSDSR